MNARNYISAALGIEPVPLIVSIEDAAGPDGITRVEKEIEIYGIMQNMDALDNATHWEIQEQWGLYVPQTDKNAGSGNTRVRMTQCSAGETTYILTTKVKQANGNGECEEPSSVDMFNLFKRLADTGLRKKRYFFPIEGTEMKFEVDVFTGPDGTPIPHVKIDLEIHGDIPDDFNINEVKLPFEMTDIKIISPGRKNAEDLAYVRKLFSEKYDLPNLLRDTVSTEGKFKEIYSDVFPNGITGSDDKEGEAVSSDSLVVHRDALVDIATRCSGLALALSDDDGREGIVKRTLNETDHVIKGALLKKDSNSDGDHEFR